MRVEAIHTMSGPNIYSHRPVLVMRLRLEDLSEKESHEIPGFIERLTARLPNIGAHTCGLGYEGGFMDRLREGTYFGHIVEHVTLELAEMIGIGVKHGKTRRAGEPGLYNVIVEYKAEHAMRFLLQTAVELVAALVRNEPMVFEEKLAQARELVARRELGPSTRAIVEAAERRGIPWMRIGDGSLVQLGYGKYRRLIQAAMSSATSAIGVDIASDKALTKAILEQASLPVPYGEVVETEEEAVAAFEAIGGPVVVKPLNGFQGNGVSLNLTTAEQVCRAFRIAAKNAHRVVVEEQFVGRDYRVLVVDGKVVAACMREPAHIIGDGCHRVAELIEKANQDPRRGRGHEKPLTRIVVNDLAIAALEKQGMSLDTVPEAGRAVYLRECANLSTGGTAIDVTGLIHSSVRRMCERAARAVGLDICGIDLVTNDIGEPLQRGGIVEINASPGLRMHHYPSEGQSRDVGAEIVDMLYPADAPSRVPVVAITGTNGKTTVTRMIGHIFSQAEKVAGMTTTDGIYIGGECVFEGDTTGPRSARTILSESSVDIAVLETARGGIVRGGLGYDWADAAVITNVRPDHIGQDGIESVDDLVYIKSLVAERVREGGALILNADDEHLARLMEEPRVNRVNKRVVYFSLSPHHVLLKKHLAAGGTAYFLKDGWIVEARGRRSSRVVEASAIPATLGGVASFHIANAMAAAAAGRALGQSIEQVATALTGFSDAQNPGRVNLYQVGAGYVLIDYGHNPDAFETITRMAAAWGERRTIGIIGVPGDRGDELIAEAGAAAARGFHRLVIREDRDRRGRRPGEVAALLREAAKRAAPDIECDVVLDECEAVERELRALGEGDIIVVFYEKRQPVFDLLMRYGATPAMSVGEMSPLRGEDVRCWMLDVSAV